MGAYDSYTDANGVKWTIATGGHSMLATVLDTETRVYIPPAEDLTTVVQTPGDGTVDEVVRVAFIRLRGMIEAYAAEHKANVGLTVAAHPDAGTPWWVWALAGLAFISKRR